MGRLKPFELKCRQEDIKALEEYDIEVRELSPYHFRINGKIDLYPTSFKFHDLRSKTWGFYKRNQIIDFIHQKLKL